MIQEPFSDDVIRMPLKVHGPALPGPQEWNPTSLKGREGVGRARCGRPLADNNRSRPGPGVKPGWIGGLSAVVGGAWCIRRTNGYEWPSERNVLGRRDARATVSCTVPTRPVSSNGTGNWNRQRYTPSFSGATWPKSGRFAPSSARTRRISNLIRYATAPLNSHFWVRLRASFGGPATIRSCRATSAGR